MPAFIKTDADEKFWSRAKAYAHESYPDLTEEDDNFWKITTSIYKKMRGKKMDKKSSLVDRVLSKKAYVPLTPAAEEAMQPPMDQAGMPQAGAPAPEGSAPMPPQGTAAPIQTVPGPNGEPIDPETGFIVVDPQNGIEMEPMSGILFIKATGEFMTQDGQPIPPEQAEQIIMQAQQGGSPMDGDPNAMPAEAAQGAQMPTEAGALPPSDPAMGGQPPMDPSMLGEAPMDPAAMAMAGGAPIDPQTGLPIDPATGMFMQGTGEAPAPGAMPEDDLTSVMPGIEEFMAKYDKANERQDKINRRVLQELSGYRSDIQGLRREVQQNNDNQDTLLARLENVLNLVEGMFKRR